MSKMWIPLFLTLFLLSLSLSVSGNGLQEQRIVNDLLKPSNYDKRVRSKESSPTLVRINMFVRAIPLINTNDHTMDIQLTFRQEWNDSRLKYDNLNGDVKYVTIGDEDLIWRPDLFFSNEMESKTFDVTRPNVLIRVFPDGTILYSKRIGLKLSCPMNLKYYPFDRQVCSIKIASYGHTTDDLILLWKEGDPVQVTKYLHMPSFVLTDKSTEFCTSRTNTGEYPCLVSNLVFRRQFYPVWASTFVPSILIQFMSWLPFYFGKKRILISLISLSLMIWFCTTISNSALNQYCNMMSMWLGFLLAMNFASFVHVLWMKSSDRGKCSKTSDNQNCEESVPLQDSEEGSAEKGNNSKASNGSITTRILVQKVKSLNQKPVLLGKIIYPLIFVLFNIFYWIKAYM